MGIHISVGGRVHLNEYIAGVLGTAQGMDSDISLQLSGITVEESDFFSYQILAGFELRPIDCLVIGLRYRWDEWRRWRYFRPAIITWLN